MARPVPAEDLAVLAAVLAEVRAPAMKPTWGTGYWPWFLIAGAVAFLVPEVIALFTNSANTLSDFSWYELGISGRINNHTIAWWASLAAWWVFVGVISAHIWFRTPG